MISNQITALPRPLVMASLSWNAVLREAMTQRQELADTMVIACGDQGLPLPALIAQRKQDPHDSLFYDSFTVQHGELKTTLSSSPLSV
jgi:hypothetical protein